MKPPDGHWHRRGKPTTDDAGITMYPCTEPGCAWAVFEHPGGHTEWTTERETPVEKTKRLHAKNKPAHDAAQAKRKADRDAATAT
jgi:hypothetical protein